MALEAKRVAFGAKQVVNIAAVGGMAGGASDIRARKQPIAILRGFVDLIRGCEGA